MSLAAEEVERSSLLSKCQGATELKCRHLPMNFLKLSTTYATSQAKVKECRQRCPNQESQQPEQRVQQPPLFRLRSKEVAQLLLVSNY